MREGGVLWKDYLICHLMFVILYNIDKVGMVLNNNSKGPTTKRPRQLGSSQKASQGARQKCKSGKSAQRVYFKVSFTKQKEQLLHLLLHRLTLFVK